MYTMEDIKIKANIVRDTVDAVLLEDGLSVDKMFLCGSYASGRQSERSDIDYLVIVKGGKRALTYPTWKRIKEIDARINSKRIHIIYGVSEEAQASLCKKDPIKYAYKPL